MKPDPTATPSTVSRRNSLLDAHHRFGAASATAAITYLSLRGHTVLSTQLVMTWTIFALTIVVLAWAVILTKDPYESKRNASIQDASQAFLFTAVISAATVSLFALFLLLASSKSLPPTEFALHLTLSVIAIVLSWILVHTLFSLRYAHIYYADAHKFTRDKIKGGLEFPGDEDPDFLDFAYFSFVVGMTCQVSDVQITSRPMRRLALMHGLISFVFNTAVLAMFVNVIASLI